MMDGLNNGWGMGFGWIVGLLVLVLFIGLIVNALRRNKNSTRPKYNSPQDILKIRYAKGEISKEEYDEKRRHIS